MRFSAPQKNAMLAARPGSAGECRVMLLRRTAGEEKTVRARIWAMTAGFILAGGIASLPAMADVSWSGPGWYINGVHTDDQGYPDGLSLLFGPFSSEAECKSALSALPADEQEDVECDHFAKEP